MSCLTSEAGAYFFRISSFLLSSSFSFSRAAASSVVLIILHCNVPRESELEITDTFISWLKQYTHAHLIFQLGNSGFFVQILTYKIEKKLQFIHNIEKITTKFIPSTWWNSIQETAKQLLILYLKGNNDQLFCKKIMNNFFMEYPTP